MLGRFDLASPMPSTRQKIILLDFNPHPRRLAAARASPVSPTLFHGDEDGGLSGPSPPPVADDAPKRKSKVEVVRSPTVIEMQDASGQFATVIRSELPYVRTEVTIDGFGRPSEFMLDGERLIQLSVSCLSRF